MSRKRANKDVAYTILIPLTKYNELKITATNRGMSLAAFMRQAAFEAMQQNKLQNAA
jgi:hypothetical protein